MTKIKVKSRCSSNSSTEFLGDGNTSLPKKQVSPSIHWCFTINNYSEKDIKYFSSNSSIFRRYVFQEELGIEGTPHLQGYCEFTRKVRPSGLVPNKKIHWEKCRNINASIEYCRKGETRSGNIYTFNIRAALKDPIKDYRGWQLELISMLEEEADDRSINWFIDEKGNAGKTTFAKHWCMKYPKESLYLSGKASDMKCAIVQFLQDDTNELKYVFMDLPRSIESFVSYQGIEEIKNGIFFSGKYESGMIMYNSPHVVIFSNFIPDLKMLSQDRWNIQIIEKE